MGFIVKVSESRDASLWELSETMGIRYNTLRKMVDDLEKLGLVTKRVKRGAPVRVVVELTDKGRKILECARILSSK